MKANHSLWTWSCALFNNQTTKKIRFLFLKNKLKLFSIIIHLLYATIWRKKQVVGSMAGAIFPIGVVLRTFCTKSNSQPQQRTLYKTTTYVCIAKYLVWEILKTFFSITSTSQFERMKSTLLISKDIIINNKTDKKYVHIKICCKFLAKIYDLGRDILQWPRHILSIDTKQDVVEVHLWL